MRNLVFVPLLILCFLCASGCVTETTSGTFSDQKKSEGNAQADDLQDKMLKEKELTDLIAALQNDPEMQAVLNDPAAMNAVLFMDMKFIDNDPRFKNLRNNPHMRKILRRLNQ
jgi:hypothetical protein